MHFFKIKNLKFKILKKLLIGAISLIVIGLPLIYLTLLNSPTASAAWFDDNWTYRKAVTVTVTSSASDVTNQQTVINVNTGTLGSKLQSGCQDLRFTNATGKLLPYYLASTCNNSTTTGVTVWVMLDLIPKNTTTYTLYMYYGNPTAAAGSNSSAFSLYNGLVGYWPMDEGGSSATTADSSGHGNTGTLSATPAGTNTTATQMWTQGSSGKYGASGGFDGTDDNIATTGRVQSQIDNWSMSAWINPANLTTMSAMIVYNGNDAGGYGLSIGGADSLPNSNRLYGIFGQVVWIDSGYIFPSANAWYHVVITRNNGTTRFYVNGVQTSGSSTSAPKPVNDYFAIGRQPQANRYFNGKIDDARVYNRALSASEVSMLYDNSQPSTSFASEETTPGPIAYWKFDDASGTSAQDSTANNKDGTISGATWQTEDQCIAGKCLYFDGTNDVVTVSNTVSGIQTVSLWIKPITTSEQIIDINGTASISVSSGTISATSFASPTIYVNGKISSTLTANTWQYVTVTTGTALSGSAIKIGQISTNYGQAFIDDVKLYPYARSASQVLTDYNSRSSVKGSSANLGSNNQNQSPVLTQGLVGYWKFDENSGISVADFSGNANTGTWNGTLGSQWTTGKYGSGGNSDGSSTYVSISNPDNFNYTTFSASAWVKITTTGYKTFIGRAMTTQGWNLLLNYPDGLGLRLDTSTGANQTTYLSSPAISDGNWHHVVVVVNLPSSSEVLYVDGKQVGTANRGGTFNETGGTLNIMGPALGTGYTPGQIDEVRIYNRALSASDVATLYNAPPRVFLKMDEGSGASANDSSSNGTTATINNGTWIPGKYGKGVSINGTSGSDVSIPDFSY